jgi:hypothetical protein
MFREMLDNCKRPSVEDRESAIMRGKRRAENSLQYQMFLATELFSKNNKDFDMEDVTARNKIMMEWSDNSRHKNGSYSKAYRDLITDPKFKGDPLKVTLEEVEYYLQNQKLKNETI